jgi:hyperosmotically inducible periplasmic protein
MTNRLLAVFCILGLAAFTVACPDRRGEADRAAEREERTFPEFQDATITGRVHAQLATDEGLRTLTDIDVTTEDGVVRLEGEVPNENMRQRAEAVAKQVDGVRRVQNDLKVVGERQ